MFNWIASLYQRPIRFRRSIFLPICIFMITTGLLYSFVEHYTSTTDYIDSLTLFSSESISYHETCDLQNETIRVINSASNDYCKAQLKNVSCQIETTPDFFPKSLPRLCPMQKGNFGDLLGCILGDENSTHYVNKLEGFESDMLCVDYCLKYSVAIAEFNEFNGLCFCSSTFYNEHRLLTVDQKCSEIMNETDHRIQHARTVYRTGFSDFGNHLQRRGETQNNTQITIIFFLTVGGRKNLRQIKRLVRIIYSRQHYYLIHVDSRENYLYHELDKLSKKHSNIHLTTKRYPTTWGASTLLTAHLEVFKQIFEELKWEFTFILNLSESDFPLKPIQVLTNFLSMYTSYNFLRSHNREPFKFIKAQGMLHTFVHCNNYMYRLAPRSLIQNIIYDGGSDWYVLNREFVHYVTYDNDELINGLRHTFNYSLLPCEAFFHTVISNSIHCDTYIRNNLRMVHWDRARGCKCQHAHAVDWCGCSPLVYRIVHKATLNDTIDKPLFFARKFDPAVDEAILDWLDEKISKRNISNGAFYLQNIYHTNDSTNNLNNVLKSIDLYARTNLTKYQEYRRHCSLDDTLHLEQIHFVFQLSIFQGYSLQYRFNDGEQVEVFIKRNSSDATLSNQVKRFEVGVELDVKEIVFIDRSKTFMEPKSIKAIIEWEDMTDNDTSLVISSPSGAIHQRIQLLPSNQPVIIHIVFPVISSSTMVGVWQMTIVKENHDNFLASLDFLVLLSNDEQLSNIQYLASFWSVVDMCSTTAINSSSCHDVSNQITTTTIHDCFQQRWSIFFFDIKSDW